MRLRIIMTICAVLLLAGFAGAQTCTINADCGPNMTRCGAGGFCQDLSNDPTNCGAIGHACDPTTGVCVHGVCTCEECDPGGFGTIQPAKRLPKLRTFVLKSRHDDIAVALAELKRKYR